ncbi:chromosomal replication initiator protein [Salinibacter ruber]|jgi:chromosomal replication initiator protein|uniref:chromosomal replication initiator protein DnaA n=1 Tax=Salinibacter ruber TaxID=146919 RepID=UPI002167DFC1|nr:chromosomal replication initiator protein DnaA [Salinibacter ruber]MCS3861219.1 chromosomal replication initiator protein [Salinibacter ruber]
MDQSADRAWNECLDIIRDNVSRQSFTTWFEPLEAHSLEDEDDLRKLTIQLPSRFYYEWIEEHYFSLLRKTVTRVLGPHGRLFYDVVIEQDDPEDPDRGASMQLPARPADPESAPPPNAPDEPEAPPSSSEASAPSSEPSAPAPSGDEARPDDAQAGAEGDEKSAPPVQNPFAIPGLKNAEVDNQLNDSYTFDRFIEGECNRLARSAAHSIATDPGETSFNPFLVYGGVGLGKTHLIQAIGNHVAARDASKTVFYVSSERFTTEFVQSIQENQIGEFSTFYRQVDVLIVDDVQFFGGKEKTQEEFFHIFNALRQAGNQIVLSADRPPREIDGLEERLLSRFQWGLSADLKPPGLDTRISILRRKAEDDGIDLDDDVVEFIAQSIESNIRELEGALIRLLAHATLHQLDITLDLAKEVLHDLFQERAATLTVDDIQRIVCEHLGISQEKMRSKTRKRDVTRARQIAMYFTKKHTQHSLKDIGLHFGGRDHSTVIHANNAVEDRMADDESFRDTVDAIGQKLERHGQ